MVFNELALNFASHMSYRQSTQKSNRVRNENKGAPVKTLANIVELEGEKVQKEISKIADDILYNNNFSENGTPNNEAKAKIYIPDKRKIRIKHKFIESKIKEYNIDKSDNLKIPITEVEKFYEDSANTINISIDDVCVKKSPSGDYEFCEF